MYLRQFFTEGLGCASYLIGCEAAGVAAVVDPDRDVKRYLEAAVAQDLRITHIIETHLHADHVSGNMDLVAASGAPIYIHEAAGVGFAHESLKANDVLELGNVHMRVLHTPGHTPESISLVISDGTRSTEPWIILTGDTLFVGDVGRPDLVGADAARELAGQLHHSLFEELLSLDDSLLVYPGHGAGSLCGRSIGSVPSTSLGYERRFNPALSVGDRDAFIEYMTNSLPEQPGNHTNIKAINRSGPKPLGEIIPRALSLNEAIPYFQRGAALLDSRPKAAFAEKHVPGSVHLALDDQLSNRAGFVLPFGAPVILLLEDEKTYRQAVLSLARVGYQAIGYLAEGISDWEAAGLPLVAGDVEDVTPSELNGMLSNGNGLVVVDVREPWEYMQGHVPGSKLIPLGQLAMRADELDPGQPVALICQSGSRSQSAAAVLGQKKFAKIYNVLGGMTDWQNAGFPTSRN
jgi:hydroxyacylglutathione hydrolase